MNSRECGQLIALAGISGCGKSLCARYLQTLGTMKVFVEPEDQFWNPAILFSHEPSAITTFTGFRGLRVPLLFEAASCREKGQVALVDSYFDKITALYIERPEMYWLLSPNDPYREELISIARKDYERLPDADVVIMMNVREFQWRKVMASRSRRFDAILMEHHYFAVQEYIRSALARWSSERGGTVIDYYQDYGEAITTAKEIAGLISRTPQKCV